MSLASVTGNRLQPCRRTATVQLAASDLDGGRDRIDQNPHTIAAIAGSYARFNRIPSVPANGGEWPPGTG
jgi:hypothetical protein